MLSQAMQRILAQLTAQTHNSELAHLLGPWFSRLPPEIRRMIYGYVLESHGRLLRPLVENGPVGSRASTYGLTTAPFDCGLLFVNSQFFKEAQEVLVECNVIHLTEDFDNATGKHRQRLEAILRMARRVYIRLQVPSPQAWWFPVLESKSNLDGCALEFGSSDFCTKWRDDTTSAKEDIRAFMRIKPRKAGNIYYRFTRNQERSLARQNLRIMRFVEEEIQPQLPHTIGTRSFME